MGRSGEFSSRSSSRPTFPSLRASPNSRTMTASGFWALPFRSRSRPTAFSLVASTARWNPPSPRSARIPPDRSNAAAAVNPRSPARVVVAGGVGRGLPCSPAAREPNPGATSGAAVRFRMVPPVLRIPIFRLTLRALGECRHGGSYPVIGQGMDDRKTSNT